jgi:hypothetical protein
MLSGKKFTSIPGYSWFCQLGLENPVTDHSSFAKNRHGRLRESETFRVGFKGIAGVAPSGPPDCYASGVRPSHPH